MQHINRPAQASDCATCEGHGEISIPATRYDDEPPTKRCPDCRGIGKEENVDHDDR